MTRTIRWVLLGSLLLVSQAYGQNDHVMTGEYGLGELVKQREMKVPKIDSEYFEVGAFVGGINNEDFGASVSKGFYANFHATEEFFFDFSFSQAQANDEVYARLGLPVFGAQRVASITYTTYGIGYSVFPGEIYLGLDRVLTSNVYLLLGAGQTRILQEDFFTLMFGLGVKVMPVDWLALRMESRALEYENALLGIEKTSHNYEISAGISAYF